MNRADVTNDMRARFETWHLIQVAKGLLPVDPSLKVALEFAFISGGEEALKLLRDAGYSPSRL